MARFAACLNIARYPTTPTHLHLGQTGGEEGYCPAGLGLSITPGTPPQKWGPGGIGPGNMVREATATTTEGKGFKPAYLRRPGLAEHRVFRTLTHMDEGIQVSWEERTILWSLGIRAYKCACRRGKQYAGPNLSAGVLPGPIQGQ